MKKGCLLTLLIAVAAGFGYHALIRGTALAELVWLPYAMAVGAAIVFGNFAGILQALRQKRVMARPPQNFQDGEFVGAAGRLHAARGPLKAPFSGRDMVIAEYAIKRDTSSSRDRSSVSDYMGFLMAPCAVQTSRGSIKLVGFPLLAQLSAETIQDEDVFQRAGQYMAACKWQEKPGSPMKFLAELNKVLTDDDGDVRADFVSPRCSAHTVDDDRSDKVAAIVENLKDDEYSFEETIIPNGAEVVVFGTYRRDRQAIDVGSGLKNLSHAVKLGTAEQVVGRDLRRAVIGLVFWGGAFAVANWFLLQHLGQTVNAS